MTLMPPPPPVEARYVVHGYDGQAHFVDRQTLEQWAKQSRITPNHWVYPERTKQWLYAHEIPLLFQDRPKVVVTDIQMPFGSMIVFMIKWAIAAIPAVIILTLLFIAITGFFTGLIGN